MGIQYFAARTAALALCLSIGACSGPSGGTASAASSSSKQDACGLLTADAISAAIGKRVGEGQKTQETGNEKAKSHMTACAWETPASPQGASAAQMMQDQVTVTLILWSWADEKRSARYIEQFRKVAQETQSAAPTPVSLGDEAILDGTSVHVRQKNASFTVSVQVFGDADQKAAGKAAETLAQQVVKQL